MRSNSSFIVSSYRRSVVPALILISSGLLVGCSTDRQLVNGTTISLLADWWYYVALVGAILVGGIGLLCGVFAPFSEEEGGFAVLGFIFLICATVVWAIWPGWESPDERFAVANSIAQEEVQAERAKGVAEQSRLAEERAVAEQARIAALALQEEERAAELAASPAGRAKLAREQRETLVKKRDGQFKPLRTEHRAELKKFVGRLKRTLPSSGYSTHKDLLEAGDEAIDLRNLLKRASILTVTADWLTSKIKRMTVAIARLEQQEWELQRRIELNQVTSEHEWKDIERMIATAKAIIEEDTPTATTQDYAAAEADLFQRLSR